MKYKILLATSGKHNAEQKFYEAVFLEAADDAGNRKYYLIRRYGKNALYDRGGGATMIEEATRYQYDNLVRTKTRGGYQFGKSHEEAVPVKYFGNLTPTDAQLVTFYKGTSQFDEICRLLNLRGSTILDTAAPEGLKAAVPVKPQFESAINPNWGTW